MVRVQCKQRTLVHIITHYFCLLFNGHDNAECVNDLNVRPSNSVKIALSLLIKNNGICVHLLRQPAFI